MPLPHSPIQCVLTWIGVGLGILAVAYLVRRLMGDRSKIENIPSLAVTAGLLIGAVASLWVLRVPVPDPENGIRAATAELLADTTRFPWMWILIAGFVAYGIGLLVRRWDAMRPILVGAWALSYPVIFMHLIRGVDFKDVGQYLLIGAVFAVVGAVTISMPWSTLKSVMPAESSQRFFWSRHWVRGQRGALDHYSSAVASSGRFCFGCPNIRRFRGLKVALCVDVRGICCRHRLSDVAGDRNLHRADPERCAVWRLHGHVAAGDRRGCALIPAWGDLGFGPDFFPTDLSGLSPRSTSRLCAVSR